MLLLVFSFFVFFLHLLDTWDCLCCFVRTMLRRIMGVTLLSPDLSPVPVRVAMVGVVVPVLNGCVSGQQLHFIVRITCFAEIVELPCAVHVVLPAFGLILPPPHMFITFFLSADNSGLMPGRVAQNFKVDSECAVQFSNQKK
eukprot:RCo045614